jgi:hypothetical protein
MRGDFIDVLQGLWNLPAPTPPLANGADEAARWLVQEMGLA